jgi:hypothetical protein
MLQSSTMFPNQFGLDYYCLVLNILSFLWMNVVFDSDDKILNRVDFTQLEFLNYILVIIFWH